MFWTTVGVEAVVVTGETGTPGENGLVPSGRAGATGVEAVEAAAVEVTVRLAVVLASAAAGEATSSVITTS